jgi:rubrerythrin
MPPEETRQDLLKILKAVNKAISMEKQAHFFYKAAADFTQSHEGMKMFSWLSKFEEGHVLKLTSRKKEYLKHPLLAGVVIPDAEDSDISETSDSEAINKFTNDIEVLKIAIKNEKRAYIFYMKKASMSPNETTKKLFENFAKEENKHIEILDDQLHSLKMNKIYKDFEKF